MEYAIEIAQVAARPLIVAKGRANERTIVDECHRILDAVWTFIQANNIANTGVNIMVYYDEPGKHLFVTEEGLPMEGGVEVKSHIAGAGDIVPSATPAGRVATTVHRGPYENLGFAHGAVQRWCKEHGHALDGRAWEVYGHMTGKPEEQVTEVFYLLA